MIAHTTAFRHLRVSVLRFGVLRDVCGIMTEKLVPKRTLERKKREAEALKANMKKRKKQEKLLADSANSQLTDPQEPNE